MPDLTTLIDNLEQAMCRIEPGERPTPADVEQVHMAIEAIRQWHERAVFEPPYDWEQRDECPQDVALAMARLD